MTDDRYFKARIKLEKWHLTGEAIEYLEEHMEKWGFKVLEETAFDSESRCKNCVSYAAGMFAGQGMCLLKDCIVSAEERCKDILRHREGNNVVQ